MIYEKNRCVSYSVADGEIGWHYVLMFNADGTFDYVGTDKFDAKELDPKYRDMIKALEVEIRAEMKRNSTFGVHEFWKLKRERLKSKGIEWRSPGELNPETRYDSGRSWLE